MATNAPAVKYHGKHARIAEFQVSQEVPHGERSKFKAFKDGVMKTVPQTAVAFRHWFKGKTGPDAPEPTDTVSLKKDLTHSKFYATVQALIYRVCALSAYCENGLVSDLSELGQIYTTLKEKRVLISLLGRFNTGKSTLLNAMLGETVLPTRQKAETSVRVLIRHSEDVHPGPCHVPEGESEIKDFTCSNCLFLEMRGKKVQGVKDVLKELKDANKKTREHNEGRQKHAGATIKVEYTLVANVPAIRGEIDTWQVYLVDNPGSGDANALINSLAGNTVKSSQAYVYLMHYRHLQDEEDQETFKEMFQKDPQIFSDQRLVVAVTHFDVSYTSLFDHDKIKAAEAKESVCRMIKVATGIDFSRDMVIPVCSEWAITARQLKLMASKDKLREKAKKFLKSYNEDHARDGKGVDVDRLESWELAKMLDHASGVKDLEQKIQRMAESSTAIWKDSLESDCARIVKESTDTLRARIKQRTDEQKEKRKMLAKLQQDLAEVDKYLDDLRSSMSKRSHIPKELNEEFTRDVDTVIEKGQEMARELWEQFDSSVKSTSGSDRHYGIQEFEQDVETFLTTCSAVLEKRFENAQFCSMQSKYVEHLMEMSSKHALLVTTAKKLCGIAPTAHAPSSPTEHGTDSAEREIEKGLEEVIAQKPPNLKHLKDQIESIEPLLSRWKKFWRTFLSFFRFQQDKLSKERLNDLTAKLRDEIAKECKTYFADIRDEVVQYFFRKYCRKTDSKLREYEKRFETMITTKRANVHQMEQFISDCQQDIVMYREWCEHLHAVEKRVHEQR